MNIINKMAIEAFCCSWVGVGIKEDKSKFV